MKPCCDKNQYSYKRIILLLVLIGCWIYIYTSNMSNTFRLIDQVKKDKDNFETIDNNKLSVQNHHHHHQEEEEEEEKINEYEQKSSIQQYDVVVSSTTRIIQEDIKTKMAKPKILTNETISTTTSCLDQNGPIPIVFLVLGKSGSSITWQILSNLTGRESKAFEMTGPTLNVSYKFFQRQQQTQAEYGYWAIRKLCNEQRQVKQEYMKKQQQQQKLLKQEEEEEESKAINNDNNDNNNSNNSIRNMIVGFQWKPFIDAMVLSHAQQTLQVFHQLASISSSSYNNLQKIKIIRSRRNPIDIKLSYMKKKKFASTHTGMRLIAHCQNNNIRCIKQHQSIVGDGLYIENVTKFYLDIYRLYHAENIIDNLLLNEYHSIPTIFVSYEELFYPHYSTNNANALSINNNNNKNTSTSTSTTTTSTNNNNNQQLAHEWNKIFQFLNVTNQNRKWYEILNVMKIASTSKSRSHKDMILNYNDVYNMFHGTDIEFLLRP